MINLACFNFTISFWGGLLVLIFLGSLAVLVFSPLVWFIAAARKKQQEEKFQSFRLSSEDVAEPAE